MKLNWCFDELVRQHKYIDTLEYFCCLLKLSRRSRRFPTCRNSVDSVLHLCVRRNIPKTGRHGDILTTRESKCLDKCLEKCLRRVSDMSKTRHFLEKNPRLRHQIYATRRSSGKGSTYVTHAEKKDEE